MGPRLHGLSWAVTLGLALGCSGEQVTPLSPVPVAPAPVAPQPAAAPTPAVAPVDALDGRFVGMESCGQNAGGTPVFAGYTLELKGGAGRLDADGYQTMIRKTVAVEGSGPSRALKLVGPGADDMFPASPAPGAVLGTLEPDPKGWRLRPAKDGLMLICAEALLLERE
ncbi:MAG: hypothetical protein JNM72_00560 [Deltaproteobacteria bacterium]|nr:hypothetical protein [Deltaproteobacteria bacterium]